MHHKEFSYGRQKMVCKLLPGYSQWAAMLLILNEMVGSEIRQDEGHSRGYRRGMREH